jgi:hypothetical protein
MASSERGKEKAQGAQSPRTAREKLEEQLGKLDIIDGEATPLVTEDREMQKCMLAGKILYCNVLHIQAIATASCQAWSNP